jgi:hypothetical protein
MLFQITNPRNRYGKNAKKSLPQSFDQIIAINNNKIRVPMISQIGPNLVLKKRTLSLDLAILNQSS